MKLETDHGLFIVEAYKIFRSKRYRESAAFIETILQKYKNIDDRYLNYLLIINYLHLGNFSRVQNLIDRIKRSSPDNESLHEIEAYILLKGSPGIELPLMKYIECSENFPQNRKFSSILKKLRECTDFSSIQKTIRLEECTLIRKPEYRRSILNRKRAIRITKFDIIGKIAAALLVCFIIFTILFMVFTAFINRKSDDRRPASGNVKTYDGKLIDLEDIRYSLIDHRSDFEYIKYYSNDSELKKDFISAQYRLKENNVNDALIILNSIYNSNANLAVKDKAVFLQNFISAIEPDDRKYAEYDIQDLLLKPAIYNGVAADFKGIVYNIKIKDGKTIFSLKPEGSQKFYIEVYFDRIVKIRENTSISVQGIFINKVSNNSIYIQGINFRKL